jgi:hypothetical protein
MRFVTAERRPRRSWTTFLGIVCIALVLLTGILRVTHSHPNGRIDPDCALCMTAHTVAQVVVVVVVQITSRPVERYVTDAYSAPLPGQPFILKRANRPPPATPAFA